MPNRRQTLQAFAALCLGASPLKILAQAAPAEAGALAAETALQATLARIEQRSGGKLGLRIVHARSGRNWTWRDDERFPMCSSFKLLLVAQALRRAADGALRLDERIRYGRNDLQAWSPITEKNVRHGGMRIGALCAATLATSDNTAANLLIARLGGPATFTAYMRSLGDEVTRLDRTEPAMNAPDPLGVLDSSSPRAMANSLQRLLLGDGLPPAQQDQLKTWLKASITGNRRLRAGLPAGWSIASKTGTSDLGSSNDVGVVWSPAGDAWVVAAFIRDSSADYLARAACRAARSAAWAEADPSHRPCAGSSSTSHWGWSSSAPLTGQRATARRGGWMAGRKGAPPGWHNAAPVGGAPSSASSSALASRPDRRWGATACSNAGLAARTRPWASTCSIGTGQSNPSHQGCGCCASLTASSTGTLHSRPWPNHSGRPPLRRTCQPRAAVQARRFRPRRRARSAAAPPGTGRPRRAPCRRAGAAGRPGGR